MRFRVIRITNYCRCASSFYFSNTDRFHLDSASAVGSDRATRNFPGVIILRPKWTSRVRQRRAPVSQKIESQAKNSRTESDCSDMKGLMHQAHKSRRTHCREERETAVHCPKSGDTGVIIAMAAYRDELSLKGNIEPVFATLYSTSPERA